MVKSADWLKKALQEANGLDIGCKLGSSLVYEQGSGRNFGLDIRSTRLKFKYPWDCVLAI